MKNKLVIIVLLISVFLLATGCTATNKSANSVPEGSSSPKQKESRTLKVAYREVGTDAPFLKEWLSKAASQIEELQKGTKIELVPVAAGGNEYYTKLALMLRSEQTSPDVVFEDSFLIGPDAQAGYLQPIPGIEQWEDWKTFYPSMQDIVKYDGKVYGVINGTDVQTIYYNKNLFRKANLPVPWQPKDWQEIITAAEEIKKLDSSLVPLWLYAGKPAGENSTFRGFGVFLWGTQEKLYDDDTKKWIVAGRGHDKVWQFLQTVHDKGLLEPEKYWSTPNASSILNLQLMPEQKVGIAFDGNWVGRNYLPNGAKPWPEAFDTYGVAKIPTSDGQQPYFTNQSGGWALSISAKSKDAQLSADFIKVASSKENLAMINALKGGVPPRNDVEKLPAMQQVLTSNAFLKDTIAFVEHSQFRPSGNGKYNQVSEVIARLTGDIALGKINAQQAAKQYEDEVTKIAGSDNVTKAAK